MNKIPDKLFNTLFIAIDDLGVGIVDYYVMLAVKGTKIAFYVYHFFTT